LIKILKEFGVSGGKERIWDLGFGIWDWEEFGISDLGFGIGKNLGFGIWDFVVV
jgi:hypothetical protein